MSRRDHQCRHDGCDSPAIFRVRLNLDCPRPGLPDFKLRTETSLRVCDRHRQAAANLLRTERNLSAIVGALAKEGIPPPDFDRVTIEFELIEEMVHASVQ